MPTSRLIDCLISLLLNCEIWPFLSKQPTIFRGKNAMMIMLDTVWLPLWKILATPLFGPTFRRYLAEKMVSLIIWSNISQLLNGKYWVLLFRSNISPSLNGENWIPLLYGPTFRRYFRFSYIWSNISPLLNGENWIPLLCGPTFRRYFRLSYFWSNISLLLTVKIGLSYYVGHATFRRYFTTKIGFSYYYKNYGKQFNQIEFLKELLPSYC